MELASGAEDLDLGAVEGLRVYFVVVRVCWGGGGRLVWVWERGEVAMRGMGGLTVVGRAWRRRADWVSHSWAVGR